MFVRSGAYHRTAQKAAMIGERGLEGPFLVFDERIVLLAPPANSAVH
jgi:hypothetical protein